MSRLPSFPPPPKGGNNGKQPSGSRPPSQLGGPQAPKRSLVPPWVIWLASAAVLVWIFYGLFAPAPTRVTLTYDQLLAQVAAGNVIQVSIKDQSVTGKLKTAIAAPP